MKRLLVFMMLLLAGCIINEPQEYTIRNDGVEGKFVEKEMSVYEGSDLEIVTEYNNEGKYSEPYGKAVIYGYDESIVSFENEGYAEGSIPKLGAKSKQSPGGYDTLIFEGAAELEHGDEYNTNLVLGTCYHYKTRVTDEICVGRESCRKGTLEPKEQGGPISISEIQYETIGDNVEMVVTVENKGDGKVIAPATSAYEACPFNLEEEHQNKATIEMEINGMQKENCDEQAVELYQNSGKTQCTFSGDLEETSEFTTQVMVEADYNYLSKDTMRLSVLGD